jgi:uncharacterized protein (TIGR02246 family)
MPVDVERRRFTADEYQRMGEAGILSRSDREELIEGEIIAGYSPKQRLLLVSFTERAPKVRIWTYSRLLLVCLASCGSLAALSAQSVPQDDGAAATVQTFVRANGTANLDLILRTFDEAATVFFPGDRPQRASGKPEIRNIFSELFKQRKGPITITPRDVEVQSFGDMVVVTAHLTSLPSGPVLEPTVFPRRTFVLRRVDGRWLIVHHHASNFVVAPARP